jgi:competence protein ComEC
MLSYRNKKLKRTTVISLFLVASLLGLYLAKYTEPLSLVWLFLIIILYPITLNKKIIFVIIYCLLAGFLLGWWRGGYLQISNKIYPGYYYKKVEVTARAVEDSVYGNRSQITFTTEDAVLDQKPLPGKIKVSGFGEPMVYRHDLVRIKGKMYPSRGGKQASISYAQIKVIARASSPIDNFRRNFVAGMQNALPEPAASFAIGLLVGQRSLLTEELLAVLTISGLTHIVAVSGYNLTIIVRAVTKALKKLSKFQVLAVSLVLIYLFLLVTGFSPSIVRASIVSLLGLTAWYFGRQFKPLLLILLAAFITGFYNPYYIWGDIGWYLSFLAFFGVLILAPLITARLKIKLPLIGDIVVESLSAQLMTLPLVVFIFGKISLIGLVANVVIVPMVPLAMLLSFFAGLAGMVSPVFAGWIALPARAILDIMLALAGWFSGLPLAQARSIISAGNMLVLYLIIFIFATALNKHIKNGKMRDK